MPVDAVSAGPALVGTKPLRRTDETILKQAWAIVLRWHFFAHAVDAYLTPKGPATDCLCMTLGSPPGESGSYGFNVPVGRRQRMAGQ